MSFVTMDDGVRLWTGTTGRGAPVVLLHGGPGLWDYLGPLAALFGDGVVVHRFDQRGCGRSGPSDEQRLDRLVADLEILRRHWGYERWAVVGHSFGATLALAYAGAHPDRLTWVGYLSGTGLGDWRTGYRAERDRRMTAGQRARLAELESLPVRSPEQEREFRTLAWFTDHADRDRAWDWAAEDAAAPYEINWVANRRLAAEAAARPEEDVRRIAVPVSVIHGAGDPRPVGSVAALAGALPDGRLHVLEGAGHHPWRERPGELGEILREVGIPAQGKSWDPRPPRGPSPGG
ncbi:alpha/beta fold hydrolase [Nonomuraea endophytica]|uniref:Proline iminopeptidase n=1 Tax=Nonomuraea endophytica TaxID=714136 RepID=A0A7W8A0B2_9ACTN|nr:alpha/beta hydrolase [Nonomuraea endophytica]MBB5077161.1 proline iminopeptidase [Nonomuraea endophytica]